MNTLFPGCVVFEKGKLKSKTDQVWSTDKGPGGKRRIFIRCIRCQTIFDISDYEFGHAVNGSSPIYAYGLHCVECRTCRGYHFFFALAGWKGPDPKIRQVLQLIQTKMGSELNYAIHMPYAGQEQVQIQLKDGSRAVIYRKSPRTYSVYVCSTNQTIKGLKEAAQFVVDQLAAPKEAEKTAFERNRHVESTL